MPEQLPVSETAPPPLTDPGEVLLIDKPLGWTSFDVVRKLKRVGNFKKIGHAGTLDPLATGLLICCTGKLTKRIDEFQAQEKEYTGTLVFGKTTPSVDLERDFDAEFPTAHVTTEALVEAARKLTGVTEQIPPVFSAVKVDGKRAYKKAHQGKGDEVVLKARTVEVSVFDLDARRFPEVDFRIVCSKGTYIRSLVRDLGRAVQSGAYLSALRRTRIGNFVIDDALTLDEFIARRPSVPPAEAS